MSLEKENNAPEPEALKPETPKKENSTGSKPVIIYIMILFIAAFLLMALSFLMHQRSNTEALGDLQNSVSAMQEVQSYQDKIIELQEELAAAVGTTRQTITSIEVGKYTASLPLAYKIAHYFGLTIEEVFDFSDLDEEQA